VIRIFHRHGFTALGALLLSVFWVSSAQAQAPDLEALTRIRQEGFHHSKVMETLSELTDRIGPRLTGSPNLKKANEWTRDQFTAWGLANSHLEAWGPFGRGWSEEFASVRMTAPDVAQLYAIPRAWTPGTNGAVRGPVIAATIKSKEDFEIYKGKLSGKVVLLGGQPEFRPEEEPQHYAQKDLDELSAYELAAERPAFTPEARAKRVEFTNQLREFLTQEKPLAVLQSTRGTDGTIFVQSGARAWQQGRQDPLPYLMMASEHFGRINRLLERKVEVELEINVATTFYDDAATFNTVAEIPGSDPKLKDEVVMLGAHLDSWTAGTGATDNGAGSAVVMEVMRILHAIGVKPRRTIRAALWTGEEEGEFGSRAYVAQHFGTRPDPADPEMRKLPSFMWKLDGRPFTTKPEQAKISAYFNLDNGSGKIRGIYGQENDAVRPIFASWIEPLKDLGVSTITMRDTGSTDHVPFDEAGIPAFQFIQDPLDYFARTHHSNMDVLEHAQRDDLMQAAVVMASFVYNTAMRDEKLPRKPLQ
jgi:carboxypeptidase Q